MNEVCKDHNFKTSSVILKPHRHTHNLGSIHGSPAFILFRINRVKKRKTFKSSISILVGLSSHSLAGQKKEDLLNAFNGTLRSL